MEQFETQGQFEKMSHDLKELFSEGVDKVHVLADFDGTFTKEFVDGKKMPSVISILRDQPGYLSPDYQKNAHTLYEKYAPFERDTSLSLAERKAKMLEWWTTHNKLLIESGIKKEHLENIATGKNLQWRPGAKEFLKSMADLNIPVVILSASGIGEVISMFCAEEKVNFPNMSYIINKFIWDENGKAIGFHGPIIHSLGKDETMVKDYDDIFQNIKNRQNVLLLGNNTGDLGMIDGFDAKKLLSFGFLDKEESELAGKFSSAFDHVVVSDGFIDINKIIKFIC